METEHNKTAPTLVPTLLEDGFITYSVLNGTHNEVFYVNEINIEVNRPDHSILAGVSLEEEIVFITFHRGWNQWTFHIDPKTQKAQTFKTLNLRQAVAKFEAYVGVKLPTITVKENGETLYQINEEMPAIKPNMKM